MCVFLCVCVRVDNYRRLRFPKVARSLRLPRGRGAPIDHSVSPPNSSSSPSSPPHQTHRAAVLIRHCRISRVRAHKRAPTLAHKRKLSGKHSHTVLTNAQHDCVKVNMIFADILVLKNTCTVTHSYTQTETHTHTHTHTHWKCTNLLPHKCSQLHVSQTHFLRTQRHTLLRLASSVTR